MDNIARYDFFFFYLCLLLRTLHNFSYVNKLQRNGVGVVLELLSSFSESILFPYLLGGGVMK